MLTKNYVLLKNDFLNFTIIKFNFLINMIKILLFKRDRKLVVVPTDKF